MVNYLVLGPMRSRLARTTELSLPLVTDLAAVGLPVELLNAAEAAREELAALPSYVVDRRIRDALDAGRLRLGVRANRGSEGAMEQLTALVHRTAASERPLPPSEGSA